MISHHLFVNIKAVYWQSSWPIDKKAHAVPVHAPQQHAIFRLLLVKMKMLMVREKKKKKVKHNRSMMVIMIVKIVVMMIRR